MEAFHSFEVEAPHNRLYGELSVVLQNGRGVIFNLFFPVLWQIFVQYPADLPHSFSNNAADFAGITAQKALILSYVISTPCKGIGRRNHTPFTKSCCRCFDWPLSITKLRALYLGIDVRSSLQSHPVRKCSERVLLYDEQLPNKLEMSSRN